MFKGNIITPERRQWRRFGVFIVNFEDIPHFFLVFLLLILNKEKLTGKSVSENTTTVLFFLTFFKRTEFETVIETINL